MGGNTKKAAGIGAPAGGTAGATAAASVTDRFLTI